MALLWDKLPERIPIHWNIHGQIDGYAGRAFGTLFMPVLNIFLALLLAIMPSRDPRVRKYDADARSSTMRVMKTVRLVVTLFNAGVAFAILAVALHYPFNMNRFIGVAMALLYIALGNFMGKLRPNYFAGFRTPWTLESRTVWIKTHQLGGRVMVAGGMVMLAAAFLVSSEQSFLWFLLPVTLAVPIIPCVYSYIYYRAEKNQNTAA